jgi:hypothetical protein
MLLVPGLFFGVFLAQAGVGNDGEIAAGALEEEAPTEAVQVADPRLVAEYHQVSDKLRSLAERQIWVGAQQAWGELVALGMPMEFEDLVIGAHLARSRGDVGETWRLLKEAAPLRTDREVIEWLWVIETEYGRVALKVEPFGGAELQASPMPVVPDKRQAIAVAAAQVEKSGSFAGMLPGGSYRLNEASFVVTPGDDVVELVVQPQPPSSNRPTPRRRQ